MDVCRTHADPLSIAARPPRKRTRVGDAAASSSAVAGSAGAASSSSSSSSATVFSPAAGISNYVATAHLDLFGNVDH